MLAWRPLLASQKEDDLPRARARGCVFFALEFPGRGGVGVI